MSLNKKILEKIMKNIDSTKIDELFTKISQNPYTQEILKEFEKMQSEMNDAFKDMESEMNTSINKSEVSDKGAYSLSFLLPGFEKNDISVELDNKTNELNIVAESKKYGKTEYTVTIEEDATIEGSVLERGFLFIYVKLPEAKSTKTKINID